MGSKETNTLTEIKDNLKKSLDAWESFLNLVEITLINDEDWAIAEKVSRPIVEALKKTEQVLELYEEEVCVLCHSHICKNRVDWDCMAKSDTKAIICKECSQLFKNCKGGN